MNRRIAGLLAGLLVVGVGACAPPAPGGGSDDGGSDSAEGQELMVWGWNQDQPWKKAVEAFNESHPEITVTYRGFKADEYNTILQTGLSGKEGPDVMMLRSYGGLDVVSSAGLLAPVSDEVPELSEFTEACVQGATSQEDSEVYGVPFAVQTANVIYNKEIFAEQGIEVPSTYAEFEAANEKLEAAGITPISTTVKDAWMLPIVRDMVGASAYGGQQFADDIRAGNAKFTDAGYTAANQALLDLKDHMPKGVDGMSDQDGRTLFAQGKAAMHPTGIWSLVSLREAAPDADFGIFDVPPLEGDGEAMTMGYVDGSWGLSARVSGGKKAAAVELLRWLAGKEYGQAMADELLQLPCVPDISPEDPLLQQAKEGFENNPAPYLTYVNFDYGSPAGTQLEYDNLQKMMLGQITPEEVGQQLDEGISQWLKPSR